MYLNLRKRDKPSSLTFSANRKVYPSSLFYKNKVIKCALFKN